MHKRPRYAPKSVAIPGTIRIQDLVQDQPKMSCTIALDEIVRSSHYPVKVTVDNPAPFLKVFPMTVHVPKGSKMVTVFIPLQPPDTLKLGDTVTVTATTGKSAHVQKVAEDSGVMTIVA